MYQTNASLDHLANIMIVKVAISARNIASTSPDLREWVLMSLVLNPSFSSPILRAATRNLSSIVADEKVDSLLSTKIVLI